MKTDIVIGLMHESGNILEAYSRCFADVPKKGFAHGAILHNRGRRYVNIGTISEAKWEIIRNKEKVI